MDINTHEIGAYKDWRLGLSTREVYRINKNLFHIHDFCNGWAIARVTKKTLVKLYNGEKSILELNWT